MTKFEDHLWREVLREHGDAPTQVRMPTPRHRRSRPRLLAGSGLGLAGAGGVAAILLAATPASPAFAVSRNHDGTVSISITRSSGVAGANAKLHQLGIRATVMAQAPSDCAPTLSHPTGTQSASAPSLDTPEIANSHWTIDPRRIPADSTLALTPPPVPRGVQTGKSADSGQMWSCGTEGPGPGNSSPPPNPASSNNANRDTGTSS
ncbi:MAG: hypothetical protein ACRET2_18605 [Steroidobacteraceae bacterium]